MVPFMKRIPVTENNVTQHYAVIRRGLGPLTTKYGTFWQYCFTIDDRWERYSVVVAGNINISTFQPEFKDESRLIVRTDSGCETGQLFGDLTCECKDQLQLAMHTIAEAGEGVIVNIPGQDGRGMGLPFKLATLLLQQQLGVNTVESASVLAPDSIIDIRTYSGVVAILKFFNVPTTTVISLATNNPHKEGVFRDNGYTVRDDIPMVIEPNVHTKRHLAAKVKHLGHRCDSKEDQQ
jgi:3,4-dihydroxy 2-butanone 4-phosphate synthase/GTP cyclohydrolase II